MKGMIEKVIRYKIPSFTTENVTYDVILGYRHTCSCKAFAAAALKDNTIFGCKHISEAAMRAEEDGSWERLGGNDEHLDSQLWTEAFGLEAIARAYQDGIRFGRALAKDARG